MFRNIGETITMIFIIILVYSVFVLLSFILVKSTNTAIQLCVESPIVFIFYISILVIICYGIIKFINSRKIND